MMLAASFVVLGMVLSLGTIVDAQADQFPPTVSRNETILNCYSCRGGPASPCGEASVELARSCAGGGAQCFENFVSYTNHSMHLVVRGCWVPSTNVTDYCKSFEQTNDPKQAESLACNTCDEEMCNGSNTFYDTKGIFVQTF